MKKSSIALLLISSTLAGPDAGATNATGFIANTGCTDLTTEVDTRDAELYLLKLSAVATDRDNDWLWNIERKTEANSDVQALLDSAGYWSTGDVWALPQQGSDVAFGYITMSGGGLYVDNSNAASVDWGAARVQRVGDSLPVGVDAGIGLVLPGRAALYPVTVAPMRTRMFPMATTSGSLVMAFGTIAEVNDNDVVPGACQIGGPFFNPRDPTRGGIIGYNVYRVPQCGCVPTEDAFHAALLTDDDSDGGWIYFIDLREFNVTVPDGFPPVPGVPSPVDLDPLDSAGLQNPDGRMYSGDEVMFFADDGNTTRPRPGDLRPSAGVSYWYRLQPVVYGTVSSFGNASFTTNAVFPGDHRMDLDGDGEFDAVSLNTVAPGHDTPEFISPQAEPGNGGEDGLGLTHRGRCLLSDCFYIDLTLPLAASGRVALAGSADRGRVTLTLSTGLESGDVRGYDVYRLDGTRRVRVNDQTILAQGGESNVYTLTDAGLATRGMHDVQYVVETISTASATPATSGPFVVPLAAPGERRRR